MYNQKKERPCQCMGVFACDISLGVRRIGLERISIARERQRWIQKSMLDSPMVL
jgi:hypothetical protein